PLWEDRRTRRCHPLSGLPTQGQVGNLVFCKLRHIVEEMVNTEREYVRSLRYIIHHYFPEMDRGDLPQDLRGKRSVVFGNLEKLLDFHNQFFLKELEACSKHPLRVPHCFLRHEQFGLYALYSKNKPKSDALLANHGHSFFRRKQLELGDKMDLSSYLLKPVQRMSKYALLLTDLMKEVGVAQEAELAALQSATNMVKFQLRHGNDLLAMDAIRDCDVSVSASQLNACRRCVTCCCTRTSAPEILTAEGVERVSGSGLLEPDEFGIVSHSLMFVKLVGSPCRNSWIQNPDELQKLNQF
uniref:DH domain-containing protein n=1 Tax=Amphilophus citrinellus TaxID=61819 RepID=A0A3Q0R1X8_AMPCI